MNGRGPRLAAPSPPPGSRTRPPIWSLLPLTLYLTLLLGVPSLAQRCDCPKGMEHLCRCNVLIDAKVVQQQFAYLDRLLLAEFAEYLEQSPVAAVRLGKREEMVLKGEAAQGFIDTESKESESGLLIVLSPTLRRDEALMVLAHELGHAWQFSSRPDVDAISDFLAEGFAEWVAFRLTRRAGLTEFAFRIKASRDPLYGEAFRWFLDIEQQHGTGAVISVMLNWVDRDGHRGTVP